MMNKFKLGDVCSIIKGTTGIQKAIAGEYPLVVTAETRSTCNEYQFDCKAVCIPLVSSTGHGHASLKRIHYQEGKFALGNILAAVIPNDENQLNAEYLYHYLTFYKDEKIVTLMKGAANVSLTINSVKTIEIDVPDIETQLKIVKSINNVKNTSSLLNDKIAKQEVNTKQLRQSILQEAIQGKLVEQDPNDEPAIELLKKIQAEKEHLIKEGKIKKEKPLPAITKAEILYDLPQNWRWVRLSDVSWSTSGGTPNRSNSLYYGGNIPWIKSGELNDGLITSCEEYITEEGLQNSSAKIYPKGTFVVAMYGATVGKVGILDFDSTSNQAVCAIFPFFDIYQQYLFWFFRQKRIDFLKTSFGAAQPNISQIVIKNTLMPLPPFKEQKRIAKKVEELMKFCDDLENQISQSKKYSEQLIQSILQEVFNPKIQSDKNSSVIHLNSIIKKRALADAEIKTQLHNQKNFGATKNEKLLYLFEKHQGVNLGGKYAKWAAGPYDYESRHKVDSILTEYKWFNITKENNDNNSRVTCEPAENHEEYKSAFDLFFTDEEKSKLQEIIDIFRNKTTKECEAIATLYAVWNDFLIDNRTFNDDDIVNGFRNNWDESKKDFNPNDLRDYLVWMRSKGLIPNGHGEKTIELREYNLM